MVVSNTPFPEFYFQWQAVSFREGILLATLRGRLFVDLHGMDPIYSDRLCGSCITSFCAIFREWKERFFDSFRVDIYQETGQWDIISVEEIDSSSA